MEIQLIYQSKSLDTWINAVLACHRNTEYILISVKGEQN